MNKTHADTFGPVWSASDWQTQEDLAVLEDIKAKQQFEKEQRIAELETSRLTLSSTFATYMKLLDDFSLESGWRKSDPYVNTGFLVYDNVGDSPEAPVTALIVDLSPRLPTRPLPYFRFAGWLERKFFSNGMVSRCRTSILPHDTDASWIYGRNQWWKGTPNDKLVNQLRYAFQVVR